MNPSFLLELMEDLADTAVRYGGTIDRPGEEQAADDYERAYAKLENALNALVSHLEEE